MENRKRLIPLIPAAAALGVCVFGGMGLFSGNIMRYLLQIFLYVTLGEAWNLLSGFAGMTSLGQQLYVGLAGYALTVVTSLWKMPFSLGLLLGVLVCVVASCLLSLQHRIIRKDFSSETDGLNMTLNFFTLMQSEISRQPWR